MNTIKYEQFGNDDGAKRSFMWGALSWLAVAAMLLLTLGARADDESLAKMEATAAQSTIVDRSAADRAWNEREDKKAGSYVGQPGIY